jgi:hypothetical protein
MEKNPAAPSCCPPPGAPALPPKLAIVAGGGALPAKLVAACRAAGRDYFVLALEGQADDATLTAGPHAWVRLGAAAEAERVLRAAGVEEIVFAGNVRRPSLREIRPDWRAAKVMLRAAVRALGDDKLLRAIIREVEDEGLRVVSVQSILSDALAVEGPYGRHRPDRQARLDIRRGIEVATGLGALDIGQGVIVQQGIVLGVEAIEGTDNLIRRCRDLRRDGPRGVLVKLRKPGQDGRVDLPTIGPHTVESAAVSDLAGIAIEAGGALVIDREAVRGKADAAGLFVVGVKVARA